MTIYDKYPFLSGLDDNYIQEFVDILLKMESVKYEEVRMYPFLRSLSTREIDVLKDITSSNLRKWYLLINALYAETTKRRG